MGPEAPPVGAGAKPFTEESVEALGSGFVPVVGFLDVDPVVTEVIRKPGSCFVGPELPLFRLL